MEYTKSDLNWLMKKTEACSNRYMEAEKFILEITEMSWWKRLFLNRKILKFLNSRSKYGF
jgi:hypothetical protein